MRLHDILRQKGTIVHTIAPNTTADDAVTELVRHNIGSLMVCPESTDGQPPTVLGIVTERDLLRAQEAHQVPLGQLPVRQVMSAQLITASPWTQVEEAMRLMTEHRVRHLPVLVDGQLVGLVSIGDIIKAKYDELMTENYYMRNYILGVGADMEMRW